MTKNKSCDSNWQNTLSSWQVDLFMIWIVRINCYLTRHRKYDLNCRNKLFSLLLNQTVIWNCQNILFNWQYLKCMIFYLCLMFIYSVNCINIAFHSFWCIMCLKLDKLRYTTNRIGITFIHVLYGIMHRYAYIIMHKLCIKVYLTINKKYVFVLRNNLIYWQGNDL